MIEEPNLPPDRARRRLSASPADTDSLLGARRAEKVEETPAELTGEKAQVETEQVEEAHQLTGKQPAPDIEVVDELRIDATAAETASAESTTVEPTADSGTSEDPSAEESAESAPIGLTGQEAADEITQERLRAVQDKPRWLKTRATIIALAVPLAIFGLAARLISSTGFLWVEYHRPGFPADSYGFSTDERMRYGSYGVNYILNFAPSSYLADLTTNGRTKLFLPTEVAHMTDVKHVMIAGMLLATCVVLLALLGSRGLPQRSAGTVRKSLFVGSLLSLVLLIALGVLAVLGWDSFFTQFHHLLFPQGNWEFRLSDTLIRLYPPQFWVDAGIAFVVLAVLATVLLLLATWPTKNRRARAELVRQFRQDQQKNLLQG